jgi:hypothetical protein
MATTTVERANSDAFSWFNDRNAVEGWNPPGEDLPARRS